MRRQLVSHGGMRRTSGNQTRPGLRRDPGITARCGLSFGLLIVVATVIVIIVMAAGATEAASRRTPTPVVIPPPVSALVPPVIDHQSTNSAPPVLPQPITTRSAAVRMAVSVPEPEGSAVAQLPQIPPVPQIPSPTVVLYGDSLAWEAKDFFVWAFRNRRGVEVVTRTFGGTAICDWLPEMSDDALRLAPGVVVIEFSGNALTDCVEDPDGLALTGEALVARYRADAEAAIAIFAETGTQVVFAGAPISRSAEQQADGIRDGRLNRLYEELAGQHPGVRYVDAGEAVLDAGRWAPTLPCLSAEPCTGGSDSTGQSVNVVRSPDGIHFCPAAADAERGVTGACPVWSSGAFRYAGAMAASVLEAFVPR